MLNAFIAKNVSVAADSYVSEDVRLLVDGEDRSQEFIDKFEIDGFVVIKPGDNPTVAVFDVDHNHHKGGYCAYYEDGKWRPVFWSESTGYQ